MCMGPERALDPNLSSSSSLQVKDTQFSISKETWGHIDFHGFDALLYSHIYTCQNADQITNVQHPLHDIDPEHFKQSDASFYNHGYYYRYGFISITAVSL